jgi:transcriptional regulator with XRE-family HTH domain
MVEEITISSRLGKFIESMDFSQNEFAKSVGISSPLISQMLNKNSNFGIDTLKKIIDAFPQLNTEWLIKGEGEMILSTQSPVSLAGETSVKIPVIQNQKYFDYVNDIIDIEIKNFPEMVLPSHEFFNPKTASFQINFDNMMPSLYMNDYVIAEQCPNWQHNLYEGQIYVIATKNGVFFKRFKEYRHSELVFENDNPAYLNDTFYSNEIKEIWTAKSKLSFYLKKQKDAIQNMENLSGLLKSIQNNISSSHLPIPENNQNRFKSYFASLFSSLKAQKIAIFYYGQFSSKIVLALKERIKENINTHFKNNIKTKKRIYNLCIDAFPRMYDATENTEAFFSLISNETATHIALGSVHEKEFADNLMKELEQLKTKNRTEQIHFLKKAIDKDIHHKKDSIALSLISLVLQSENSFETFLEEADNNKSLFILKIKLNGL